MAKKAKSGTSKKSARKMRDVKPTPAKSRMIKGGRRMISDS